MASEITRKSIKELKEMAKNLKIKGYGTMKKKELISSISKKEKGKGSNMPQQKTAQMVKENISTAVAEDTNRMGTSSMYNGQEQICESKYSTTYCHRQPYVEDNFVFPKQYDQNSIVLMVRDPYWAYTYWNIPEETFAGLRNTYGEAAINTSRLTLRVKEITGKSPDHPNESYDVYPPIGTTNWYVNLNKHNASYCVEIGLLLANNEFIMKARSNVIHSPLFGPSDVIDEKWASLVDFEKIYALSGGFDVGKSSGELRKEMVKRLEEALFSGGSGAVTSFGKKKKVTGKGKSFFLIVNTELIVYGQTVPSASLTIQGKEHKLNPDGTFSIRFALPEGVQEIPVTSVSEDKEDTITITPVVTKETR